MAKNSMDLRARNSFILIGWAVTLVIVSFLLEGREIDYTNAFFPVRARGDYCG